jgi:hypothetical protein
MLDQLLLSAGLFKLQELLISTLQVFAKHSAACTDKLSVLQARYAPLEVDEHASYVARLSGESKSLGVKSQSARKLLAALNAGDVSSRVLSLRPLAQTNFGEQCAWGSRRDHLGWFDFNLSTIDMNYDLGNQQTCRRELFLDTELESRVVVEPDDGELELHAGLSPVVSGAREGRYWVRFFATPVAILAAIYASQFMHPRWKSRIKPTIEMMASLPSVVLGFMAGLVFSPVIERGLMPLMTGFFVMPVAILLAAHLWQLIPSGWRTRHPGWRPAAHPLPTTTPRSRAHRGSEDLAAWQPVNGVATRSCFETTKKQPTARSDLV